MKEILASLPFVLGALFCVTLIDTVGALLSRKFQFNYGLMTPFSLLIYTQLGYLVSEVAGLNMVLLSSLFVGLYDATIGWKLSKLCKAQVELPKELEEKLTTNHSLMVMSLIAPVFAIIGYSIH